MIAGRRQYDVTYLPNSGLTQSERQALAACAQHLQLESAVRKIIADACAGGLFELLNYIDGTSTPKMGEWHGTRRSQLTAVYNVGISPEETACSISQAALPW